MRDRYMAGLLRRPRLAFEANHRGLRRREESPRALTSCLCCLAERGHEPAPVPLAGARQRQADPALATEAEGLIPSAAPIEEAFVP